jgi:hypothetical protein
MEPSEFPPNNEASKRPGIDKNIEKVTSGQTKRRKRSLRKQFVDMFMAGDPRSAAQYALIDVLLPMIRDTVWETGSEYLRSLLQGGTRRRGGSTIPPSGPLGHVNYTRFSGPMAGSRMSSSMRAMSRSARARHDFDEIVLESRTEAEEVIDRLFDLVAKYETATVADLYELVGLPSNYTDHRWGWTDVRGAGVTRIRDGYLLDLPDPYPLD